ncbi:family 20 glycosylhydrolase [Luteolibacter luteus]|uniref:Family 20 glycosylhydrolase n=1 Tax=Luteolibacter luteus TaxID=2728835 RepID=A0A858RIS0_9BACT|nr:family 20 glycosylhydrolase [Luteolibacter luteus]QJE96319.1 family 20 glycosylhydrolase [Luteolibacter luteus]
MVAPVSLACAFSLFLGAGLLHAAENPEPSVIPSLQQWQGREAATVFGPATRLLISSDELSDLAEGVAHDLLLQTGSLPAVAKGEPHPGDIALVLDPAFPQPGKEAYALEAGEHLTLTARHHLGILRGSRTLLQVLSQAPSHDRFPCGKAIDFPKYRMRGVTLDVSRKFYTIGYLRRLVRDLAWYKLNVLHLHLTDDQAFRLESETFPGLAAKDGHYTKQEFRDLIELGKSLGVTVVPEINGPGHVGAILRYRPELGSHGAFDLRNPAGMEFMKKLWSEYLDPRHPTFTGPVVHIGTDEVETSTQEDRELLRAWMNEIFAHVHAYGKEAHAWGGLDRYSGTTPVDKRLQIDLWNWGWGNAATALPAGHRLTNIDDAKLYIVPYSGIYRDYLDTADLYRNWEPNQFPALTVPADHPQMNGANFAIWNDRSPSYGISMDDTTDRLLAAVPVFAEKCWRGSREDADYSAFQTRSSLIKEDPAANLRYSAATVAKDGSLLTYRFDGDLDDRSGNDRTGHAKNIAFIPGETGQALQLKGGESYVATPLEAKGFGYTLSFSLKPDPGNPPDAIILESPQGTLTLNTKGSGKLGFAKEGDTTLFDFAPPADQWSDITLTGDSKGTCLYVNGDEHVERLVHRMRLTTFALPLARIGSDHHAFIGAIDNFTVLDRPVDLLGAGRNLALGKPVTASSWELGRAELAPGKAVDGDLSTRWSTAAIPDGWLTVDLGKIETLDRAVIHWEIQRGARYKMLASKDGESWVNVLADDSTFTVERRFDPLSFPPVEARFLKFQGVELSNWGYAIFEIELYGPGRKLESAYRDAISRARSLLAQEGGDPAERARAADLVADFPLGMEGGSPSGNPR